MGNKTCNKCGKTGLDWNQEYHKDEGRWILDYHQDDKGRWCSKKKKKWVNIVKTDIKRCKVCVDSDSIGWLLTEEAHIKNPEWTYVSEKEHLRVIHNIE